MFGTASASHVSHPSICTSVAVQLPVGLPVEQGELPFLPISTHFHAILTTSPTSHLSPCVPALQMLVSLLLDRGDSLLLEEYSYPHMLECVVAPKGLTAVPLPIDEQGIIPEAMEQVGGGWLVGGGGHGKTVGRVGCAWHGSL